MDQQQLNSSHLRKDLIAIFFLGLLVIAILVILAIVENRSGQISLWSQQITDFLIK